MFEQQDELQERRLQHQLEMQSMQIEHVFNRHQVDAHVAGGTVKPRSISFNLQAQLATGLERLKVLTDDLMHTLGVPVSLSQEGEQLRLDVSQRSTPPVSLLDLMSLLAELPPVTAVLGLAEDGRPVLLDFTEQDMTHILVSGLSDAGKTALLRSLVISLALMNRQSRVQFVVFDGKPDDAVTDTNLHSLNYLPHMLADVMRHQEDVRETLSFLTSEVSYRLEYGVMAPTIVVIMDEVVSLLEMGGPPVRDAIISLVQRGSEVGVHLVMSTEKPQTAVLDNLFKANISVQIVGRLADSTQARIVTGLQGSQAEYLLGQGDFLAVAGQYMTHFQAAYIGDYDLHLTLQELHRKRPPTLLAQSVDEQQPISLSGPETDEGRHGLPQHFLYEGDAIALSYEDISPSPIVVEAEEPGTKDVAVEEQASVYVPQPVIKLFHDAPAEEVEDLAGAEEEVEPTADLPRHVPAEKNMPGVVTIKQALAETQLQAEDIVDVKADLDEGASPAIHSPAEGGANSLMDAEEIVEEEVAVSYTEDDEVEAEEGSGEPESEYEPFEDDWLPFDDD